MEDLKNNMVTVNMRNDVLAVNNGYNNPSDIVNGIGKDDLSGTKVMLINMPIREQAKPNNAPLGLALLAGRLLEYDVDVIMVDLNAYRVKDDEATKKGLENGRVLHEIEIENLIKQYIEHYGDQDLIAMSGLITTLTWQKKVSEVIRKYQPATMIASGGGLATEFRSVLFEFSFPFNLKLVLETFNELLF